MEEKFVVSQTEMYVPSISLVLVSSVLAKFSLEPNSIPYLLIVCLYDYVSILYDWHSS